ncbi:MAG: 50S ribosomal protein L24 [Elusimicrobiota bacterium]|jgi:large subunit ribosomal protein L24
MSLIRKKDKVLVLAGKNRGKQGEVVQVLKGNDRVIVSKVNFIKRHTRPTQTQPGGIREKEAPLHLSNVMLICPKCNRAMRPKSDQLTDGTKVRICRKCGEMLVS